ncbi:MAG: hypothetical protein KME31_30810 [Tolypothrix carrinoi HA7290-LM1]|nr:hypothetical protein [Tolypothrix carrinoi HA7290-LM1]
MLRRSLFACALMLAGVVGFASSAKAQVVSPTLSLTGSIPESCTFGTKTDGALAANADNTTLNTTTPATVIVNCAGGTLKVSTPIKDPASTGTTADADLTKVATLKSGANAVNSGAATGIDAPATNTPVDVSMTASRTDGTALATGNYVFNVTVTATK